MKGNGFKFPLDLGERETFRAKVIPLVSDPGELCLAGGFFAKPDAFDRVGIVYINSTSICG